MNYYSGKLGLPYHLSVGAIVVNEKKEVGCRHYSANEHEEQGELYVVMRETMEPGETIEQTLARGCQEELGLTVEIKEFIGSIVSHFSRGTETVEKTTLYFLCEPRSEVPAEPGGFEATGTIEWQPLDWLIEQSKKQGKHFGRDDYDESAVLERAAQLIG